MVYLMALHGAKGILYYARRAPYVMPTNFALWAEYRLIAMEFAEIGSALLSGNVSTPTVALEGECRAADAAAAGSPAARPAATGVTARVFDTPTETVILLANVANTSRSFILDSEALPHGPGSLEVLFENRALPLDTFGDRGRFSDTIDAMGTRAYRLSKLPPPPPPASQPLLVNGGFELASSVGVPDALYAVPHAGGHFPPSAARRGLTAWLGEGLEAWPDACSGIRRNHRLPNLAGTETSALLSSSTRDSPPLAGTLCE